MLRVVPDLVRLRSHRSVSGFVNRHIEDERLRQVFSFHPLLVGGNPAGLPGVISSGKIVADMIGEVVNSDRNTAW